MVLLFLYNFDYINYSFFLLSSLGIYYLYKIFHIQMINNNKYKQLKYHKKKYVIKNFIKTGVMIYIIYQLFCYEYIHFINGTLDGDSLRFYGGLYISNDFMGLIMVRNLPSNTKNHHIISVILYTIFCFIQDINNNIIAKCMIYYTILSCIPFLVNFYLGLRFFSDYNTNENGIIEFHQIQLNIFIDVIRILAYYIYAISLVFNISLQIYIMYSGGYSYYNLISNLIYSLMLVPIIQDDFILLSWLRNKQISY